MGREIIKYTLMFVGLVLTQVLVFNHIQFSGFVNPYIYILFIMLLPLSSPRYLVLIAAFVLGIIIDVFSNSLGVHAFATVFMAYMRPLIIRAISNREEDKSNYPGLLQFKFRWFISYTAIMVLIHHLLLFYLEVYTFSNFLETLVRILLSSVFSIVVIILSQFIVFRD